MSGERSAKIANQLHYSIIGDTLMVEDTCLVRKYILNSKVRQFVATTTKAQVKLNNIDVQSYLNFQGKVFQSSQL